MREVGVEDRLLVPEEAARLLFTSTKNLSVWAKNGRLERRGVRTVRTLGGHRRYPVADVLALRRRLYDGEVVSGG